MPGSDLILVGPAGDLAPAALEAEVRRLAAAAADYADASKASATRRAYNSRWRQFSSWCVAHGFAGEAPTDPNVLILYMTDVAPRLSVSTMFQTIAAIAEVHRRENLPPPASSRLDEVWSGIRRTRGRPPRKKRALVTAELRKVVARLPPTLAGSRDRALFLLGFSGALRRSELVALWLDWPADDVAACRCSFVAGGLLIDLGRSKTDQEGRGHQVAIPHGKTALCPVAALRDWLDISQISCGPIFRGVDRHGRLGAEALTGKSASEIVKRGVAHTKLDPRLFGAHSLRAGFITSAAAGGADLQLIMRQSRHKKTETVMGYVREAEFFTRNAASKVGL